MKRENGAYRVYSLYVGWLSPGSGVPGDFFLSFIFRIL